VQAPPQARAVLGQFLVGNEEVGYRIGVPSVWPTKGATPQQTITGQATTGQATTGGSLVSGWFGSLTFKTIYPQTIPVSGVASAQSFGAIKLALKFGPGGVPSAQAFGTPTIKTAISRSVGSVSSAQAFGALTIKSAIAKSVTGVSSAQSFGTPTTKAVIVKPVAGVGSAQSFGSLTIKTVVKTGPGGVPTAQAFGTITPKATVTRTVTGLGSAQAFGAITTRTGFTKPVPGLGTAQAFGTVSARTVITVQVGGVPSAQAFGVFIPGQRVQVGGVASAQAFGVPDAYIAWIEDTDCVDLDLVGISCSDDDLGEITCVEPQETICGVPITGDGHVCGGISVMWELDCIDTWPGAEGGTHGAILNEFLVGDGTLLGSESTVGGKEEGYFLDNLPPAVELDLEEVGCV